MFITESLYKNNAPCKAKCNYWITSLRTKLLTLTLLHRVCSECFTVAFQTALSSVGAVSGNLFL